MAEFYIKKVQGNDRFIAGGAVLFLLVSFVPWRSTSNIGGYGSGHVSMFGQDSYGWPKLALLLSLVAGAIVIARLVGALDNVALPAGVNLITLAANGLATLILLIQFAFGFTDFSFFSIHPGLGYYLGLVISAGATYFSFLNFKSSGEQLPSKSDWAPPAP